MIAWRKPCCCSRPGGGGAGMGVRDRAWGGGGGVTTGTVIHTPYRKLHPLPSNADSLPSFKMDIDCITHSKPTPLGLI